MEKTLCDDCSKEAEEKVGGRYFCWNCAVRVLQQVPSGQQQRVGVQRKQTGALS